MLRTFLSLTLLLVGAFSLTTRLEPWYRSWAGERAQSGNVLTILLGDSRRLFAKHFYVKADAYFHSGYYPSIFDTASSSESLHISANAGAGHEGEMEEGEDFLGQPKDWIDKFSRDFYPTHHRHLGEDEEVGDHHEHKPGEVSDGRHEKDSSGNERELLPWLRLASELDPQRPESYIVASFWLRTRLGKVDEAEQFLREGLRANPGDYEILFELGRIYHENRNDPERARNLWELALAKWLEREQGKTEPNIFLYAQLLGNLAKLEEDQQNYSRAIEYLEKLKAVSPNKEYLEKWIDELRAKPAP